jgi:hypothetical protein
MNIRCPSFNTTRVLVGKYLDVKSDRLYWPIGTGRKTGTFTTAAAK